MEDFDIDDILKTVDNMNDMNTNILNDLQLRTPILIKQQPVVTLQQQPVRTLRPKINNNQLSNNRNTINMPHDPVDSVSSIEKNAVSVLPVIDNCENIIRITNICGYNIPTSTLYLILILLVLGTFFFFYTRTPKKQQKKKDDDE